ncbi:MAG: hypothetical protein HZB44_10965 [Actinobacteria bacterium]|nr:hypothetical protein [Actinomycetota bacterium]
MKCPQCGKDNHDGNWVCGSCGETLPAPSQSQQYESEYVDSGISHPAPAPARSGNSSTIVTVVAAVLMAILAAILIWNFFLKGADTSTPSGTMEAYINAISDADCDTLYDLTPEDMIPPNRDQAAEWCSQMMGLLNVGFIDYKTTGETIDGDTATVDFQVTIEAMGQSMPVDMSMNLVKEGGKWKVEPQ